MKPFSGPNYAENSAKCGDRLPCALCGKPVEKNRWWAEVVDGGSSFGTNDGTADITNPGYMGCYPVGSECRKVLEEAGVKLVDSGGG